MTRWSFRLRQLFLWTAAIALGLVALRSASMTWVATMLGLAIAVLAASSLLAIYRRGSQRAYWSGFAAFGWLYLLLVFGSWTLGRMAQEDSPLRAHNLITQQLSSISYHWLYDKAFEKYHASVGGSSTAFTGSGQNFYVWTGFGTGGSPMTSTGSMPIGITIGTPIGPPPGPNETDFVNVAHALWTLLFAVIGGAVAHWLYVTGPGRTEREASVSS